MSEAILIYFFFVSGKLLPWSSAASALGLGLILGGIWRASWVAGHHLPHTGPYARDDVAFVLP
jgi:hypothetical protein